MKQKRFFQKCLFRYGRYDVHVGNSCVNRGIFADERPDFAFGCRFKQRPCSDFQQDFRTKVVGSACIECRIVFHMYFPGFRISRIPFAVRVCVYCTVIIQSFQSDCVLQICRKHIPDEYGRCLAQSFQLLLCQITFKAEKIPVYGKVNVLREPENQIPDFG